MKPTFADTLTYRIAEQPPAPGSFFVRGQSHWYKCRERFASQFSEKTDGFYLSLKEEHCGIGVPEFMAITEELLELEEASVYQLSTNPLVIYVRPASFWKTCPIRRSLFTILLRSGMGYKPHYNTWEDALYTQNYVQLTRKAVLRFMYGCTKFVDNCGYNGWLTTFRHCDESEIRKKLIFPEGKQKFGIVGAGTLWG